MVQASTGHKLINNYYSGHKTYIVSDQWRQRAVVIATDVTDRWLLGDVLRGIDNVVYDFRHVVLSSVIQLTHDERPPSTVDRCRTLVRSYNSQRPT